MNRAYYSAPIKQFIEEDNNKIIGELLLKHSNRTLVDLQRNAWEKQILILKENLHDLEGYIFFEFIIPRMGKRVDNIIIIGDKIFVVEFKVGDNTFEKHAINQVIDYTLDLKNFHEGSHSSKLFPVLVSTKANAVENDLDRVIKHSDAIKTNEINLKELILNSLNLDKGSDLNPIDWANSIYKPTPTIVEAAQALYKGHNVKEISRSDSGAINLEFTSKCIDNIIDDSKINKTKSICFVTGVPGAGKTLAGLNIANSRMKSHEDEHAVFLSGNGPLVEVLREALARDLVQSSKENGDNITKDNAKRQTNSFIQNIHHFRDEYLNFDIKPTEKVVVFDEAQRAWNKKQVGKFMKAKRSIDNFSMSEPEFLIDVMNRHDDWCTIICLIGGGQEINTGEAGLEAWISALKDKYEDWDVHYSNLITEDSNYIKNTDLRYWLINECTREDKLHLSVSVRSFRSERISEFVHQLLEMNIIESKELYLQIKDSFPLFMTRDIDKAKKWLNEVSRGTERTGIIGSSGARRLRPHGIDVKNEISPSNWFLNDSTDIRSSYFLEEIATEFDIQGLEVDWTCVAWGGNFHIENDNWVYKNFKGTRWLNINKEEDKEYLKNSYRVLLTRARQGMIIFIPEGSKEDKTRPIEYYENTYKYLKEIGIEEI